MLDSAKLIILLFVIPICEGSALVSNDFTPSAHITKQRNFLEIFHKANQDKRCIWIILAQESPDFLDGTPLSAPCMILNSEFNKTLGSPARGQRFMSLCNFVLAPVPSPNQPPRLSSDEFVNFMNRTVWASLFTFKSPKRFNYFLLLSSGAEDVGMLEEVLLNRKAPIRYHSFKAAISWEGERVKVTNLCWHCGINGSAVNLQRDKTIPALHSSHRRNQSLANIFPDFTHDLRKKSLLISAGIENYTCRHIQKIMKKPLHNIIMPFTWFTIGSLSTHLNFRGGIHEAD
jgi:hypothetical protein